MRKRPSLLTIPIFLILKLSARMNSRSSCGRSSRDVRPPSPSKIRRTSSCGHIEVEPNSQISGLQQEFDLGGGSRAGVICLEDSPQVGDAQVQFCVCFAQFDTILLMDGPN